jgi:hypothetical protein
MTLFEDNLFFLSSLGTEELKKLLGNDGQHLDVDSVELIEATPGTSGG